ncbi:LIM domain-containing protein 1 [Myotis brandtii]|uniref:LIM domain-containing protein 1 n=1 Tax=Myotis brandtii TaxID=109478 RepID=S7NDE4_MYOBR|nr:LIM domain-containing protein 1 [Myotis brandtii]
MRGALSFQPYGSGVCISKGLARCPARIRTLRKTLQQAGGLRREVVASEGKDCGLELNDEDGHRCYPLEDHLFCQPCHVKRLEKGPPPAALHQHHF